MACFRGCIYRNSCPAVTAASQPGKCVRPFGCTLSLTTSTGSIVICSCATQINSESGDGWGAAPVGAILHSIAAPSVDCVTLGYKRGFCSVCAGPPCSPLPSTRRQPNTAGWAEEKSVGIRQRSRRWVQAWSPRTRRDRVKGGGGLLSGMSGGDSSCLCLLQ
ncbi:unnamed protein product [Pleuronectes platessa]|uniref:Uncharacterized protein n=1 Tax=Pleuronectes platessa TaxID=8262 RepID=A0A9N7VLX7_PLEPL|nr:unnamed protein product [Pleuronectes platessa]